MIMLLCSLCIFFLMIRRPPRSTLFPLHDALPISIVVEGVDRLHGVAETILPDRLEAGTFAIGAVITGGEVTLRNVREPDRSEEHTSELQSRQYLVCRLLLEKKKPHTHLHHQLAVT